MKKPFIMLFAILLAFQSFSVFAQEKITLFYDKDWKGLDTKKKAVYYRVVDYNEDGEPFGIIETFYKSGKLYSKGEAILIDKLDDSNTLWTNNLLLFSEKGVKLSDQSYDNEGKAHGPTYYYNEKGEKAQEFEFIHGNPSKDYYLVYVKGAPVKHSFLTHLPMTLATSGKILVPTSERKIIYEDGQSIQYYNINGISIAVKFTEEKQYGKYYAAYITIENGTDEEFNFDPKSFSAVLGHNDKVSPAEILTYDYYIKKVNRRQAWSGAFNAFAERQAADEAGYSASSSTGVIAGVSTSNTNAHGQVANTYANVSATTNTSTVIAGSTTAVSYNGAAKYSANQNASNNIRQYANQQYSIKKSIAQGYLKINTVFPSSRIIGFVYIKHQKADGILLNIPINGQVYQFGG